MKNLDINLPSNKYTIFIEKGLRKFLGIEIRKLYKAEKLFVITDENVFANYGNEVRESLEKEGFSVLFTIVKPGEKSKSIEVLQDVYNELLEKGITRTDMIAALGGGVIGDLSGFVAATLLRGIRFIQIPTSLLAQIDSSIGGKVAINLEKGKNLVGNFYHPEAVFIDPEMLQTLEKRFLYDGTAEVIKYGCIKSLALFEQLESFENEKEYLDHIEDVIYQCCDIKREVVEEDEKDLGNRMLLNFGHTLGHGVEEYFHYERYTHGEGVAIGMYHIVQRDEVLSNRDTQISDRIKKLLIKYKLPTEMPMMEEAHMQKTVGLDKKGSGKTIKIVLLEEIGKSYLKIIDKKDIVKYVKN